MNKTKHITQEGWQPISTAPKVERKIVLGAEGEWVGEMFWHDGSECYGHRGEAGWFSLDDWSNLLTASNIHPTHWMPLPPPPTQEGGGMNENADGVKGLDRG